MIRLRYGKRLLPGNKLIGIEEDVEFKDKLVISCKEVKSKVNGFRKSTRK